MSQGCHHLNHASNVCFVYLHKGSVYMAGLFSPCTNLPWTRACVYMYAEYVYECVSLKGTIASLALKLETYILLYERAECWSETGKARSATQLVAVVNAVRLRDKPSSRMIPILHTLPPPYSQTTH